MNEQAAQRFLDLVQRGGRKWRSVDLRTVAVRVGRQWMPLVTRGYLDHRRAEEVERLKTVDRDRLKAWQFVLPIQQLEPLVNGVVAGRIKVRPRSLFVIDGEAKSRHDVNYYFNDLASPYQPARYTLWSGHSLVAYGPTIWDLVRRSGLDPLELDNIVRAGPNPYDGFAGLVRSFHGRPGAFSDQSSSSVFELIAPMAVRFDVEGTSSSRERVVLGFRARARPFTRSAQLHWTVIRTDPQPRHGTTRLSDHRWKTVGAYVKAAIEVPIESNDIVLTASLVDDGKNLDSITLTTGHARLNPRAVAHSTSDADLTRLRTALFPTDWNRSREFEQAMGVLLHFFGFQLNPLSSQKGAGEAVDHIAHDPYSNAVISLECTVGPLEAAKLGKLGSRTEALRTVMPDAVVFAVLACARPVGELLRTELDKAEENDVIVLAREDLLALWESVETGASTADLISELRHRLTQSKMTRARSFER